MFRPRARSLLEVEMWFTFRLLERRLLTCACLFPSVTRRGHDYCNSLTAHAERLTPAYGPSGTSGKVSVDASAARRRPAEVGTLPNRRRYHANASAAPSPRTYFGIGRLRSGRGGITLSGMSHHLTIAPIRLRGFSPELRCETRRTVAYRAVCSCGWKSSGAGFGIHCRRDRRDRRR